MYKRQQVGLAGIRQRNAALLCVLEHGADTRVRVLHIVQPVSYTHLSAQALQDTGKTDLSVLTGAD